MIEYPDFEALSTAVAARLGQWARAGIEARGAASLALAGGSTPFPVYRRLAAEPIEWARVNLLPGDERWVAADHEASNLRAIRAAFADVPARFGPLVPARPGAQPNLDTAQETLASVPQPFDACVLGMGSDGHFASLFPGAPELTTALDVANPQPLVVVLPDPLPEDAPFARVSLTLSAILASRHLLLMIRGSGKRDVLEFAHDGDPEQSPIAALLQAAGPALEIHWSP